MVVAVAAPKTIAKSLVVTKATPLTTDIPGDADRHGKVVALMSASL
jgi:hypothetical protein